MSEHVLVVWDDGMLGYDLGPGHPMRSLRLELTMDLAHRLDLLSGPNVELHRPEPAGDALLALVHDPAYVQVVRIAPEDAFSVAPALFGLGTDDNPIFWGMHEAASLVTGGTVAAARAVWTGQAQHGVNIAGGLHHAARRHASGFCVYNDPAVAIRWLLEEGAQRVAYVDVDAHHGDGVQNMFWDEPRVLTISLHESPYTLFPGTGFPEEVGGGQAAGAAVNVALPAGTGDAGWLRAFDAVVPPLVRDFRPEVVVSQHGADAHRDDPLTDLRKTVDGQRRAAQLVHDLAHEVCQGRWVCTGGGGYALADVVPRAWSHLIGVAVGRPVEPDTATPEPWRELVIARTGCAAPLTMSDGPLATFRPWEPGQGDTHDPVDRAAFATRRAVFPLHGMDPWGTW